MDCQAKVYPKGESQYNRMFGRRCSRAATGLVNGKAVCKQHIHATEFADSERFETKPS